LSCVPWSNDLAVVGGIAAWRTGQRGADPRWKLGRVIGEMIGRYRARVSQVAHALGVQAADVVTAARAEADRLAGERSFVSPDDRDPSVAHAARDMDIKIANLRALRP
jgi:hypothetical protein